MSNAILTWLEAEWAKLKSSTAVSTAVTDAENIGGAGWAWIKTNGLTDFYQLALVGVAAAVPGTSWVETLATLKAQAEADGKQLIAGAEAVVAAQAQSDLIAAGKLLPPVASTTPIAA